jgi:hypothetical protein
MTVNVEYNVLGPMLLDVTGKGDEADPATGNSPYPGNTNSLIFNAAMYVFLSLSLSISHSLPHFPSLHLLPTLN